MNLTDIPQGAITGEFMDPDAPEFFAPAASDMIDGLMGQYKAMRGRIERIANSITGDDAVAVGYFLAGNGGDNNRYGLPTVDRLFQRDGAIAALNATFWSKTLALTDVLDAMPQARRDEWNKTITERTCPEYTEETVRATLESLLAARSKFFAERVDGIFRGLSGEHITNSPAGFGKRMILNYVLNDYWSVQHGKAGLINDLRCIIAKFMGRDEPKYWASASLIETLKGNWGEWINVDGGALRIRLYKKGTAHLEVHPDMAWRLNSVLSSIYPAAIPEEFRRKPKREKRAKEYQMIQRPLPFAVLEILAGMKKAYRMEAQENNWRQPYRKVDIRNAMQFDYVSGASKIAQQEAEKVLEAIGGTKTADGHFQFDYSPFDIIREIVASGCIPDQKAHQFYPTPERLARMAVDMAEIGPDDMCLEPSAGLGGLADLMPAERTTCVEISELHAKVLEAKGYNVIHSDFITWAAPSIGWQAYDRIVMNPPFSEGRAQAHVEASAKLLKRGGCMVAILPAGQKNRLTLPGFDITWSAQYDNEFAGASVSVVIMVARRGQ
jgi:hypothetical protein